MFKTKIVGIGSKGNLTYVILKKNKNFFKWLSKVLFDSFEIYDVMYFQPDPKGNMKEKQIEEFIDIHESYDSDTGRADVFYGKNKVFICIKATLKYRKVFMKSLTNNSVWEKKGQEKTLDSF